MISEYPNPVDCVDLGVGLVALLSANAGVRSLCLDDQANGMAGALRMYPSVLKQGSMLPAIVYHEISSDDEAGIGGRAAIANTRIQLDCYADTAIAAQRLRTAVERCVMPDGQPYRGESGVERITCITIAGRRSDVQTPGDGSDRYQHIRQLDLLVTHQIGM